MTTVTYLTTNISKRPGGEGTTPGWGIIVLSSHDTHFFILAQSKYILELNIRIYITDWNHLFKLRNYPVSAKNLSSGLDPEENRVDKHGKIVPISQHDSKWFSPVKCRQTSPSTFSHVPMSAPTSSLLFLLRGCFIRCISSCHWNGNFQLLS